MYLPRLTRRVRTWGQILHTSSSRRRRATPSLMVEALRCARRNRPLEGRPSHHSSHHASELKQRSRPIARVAVASELAMGLLALLALVGLGELQRREELAELLLLRLQGGDLLVLLLVRARLLRLAKLEPLADEAPSISAAT